MCNVFYDPFLYQLAVMQMTASSGVLESGRTENKSVKPLTLTIPCISSTWMSFVRYDYSRVIIRFFPPVWIWMCVFKLLLWANVTLHSLHWCGFSPVWILMCFLQDTGMAEMKFIISMQNHMIFQGRSRHKYVLTQITLQLISSPLWKY